MCRFTPRTERGQTTRKIRQDCVHHTVGKLNKSKATLRPSRYFIRSTSPLCFSLDFGRWFCAYVRNELLSLSSYATTFVEQDFPQKQAKQSRKGALADEISCALVQSPDATAPPNDRYHLAKRHLVEMISRSRLLALILAWVLRAFHPPLLCSL